MASIHGHSEGVLPQKDDRRIRAQTWLAQNVGLRILRFAQNDRRTGSEYLPPSRRVGIRAKPFLKVRLSQLLGCQRHGEAERSKYRLIRPTVRDSNRNRLAANSTPRDCFRERRPRGRRHMKRGPASAQAPFRSLPSSARLFRADQLIVGCQVPLRQTVG